MYNVYHSTRYTIIYVENVHTHLINYTFTNQFYPMNIFDPLVILYSYHVKYVAKIFKLTATDLVWIYLIIFDMLLHNLVFRMSLLINMYSFVFV